MSPDNFAHPVAKTAGCFIAILALPGLLLVASISSVPISGYAFSVCSITSLAGLSSLCGRPSAVCLAIGTIGKWADAVRCRVSRGPRAK